MPTNFGFAAARKGAPASRAIWPSKPRRTISRRDGPKVKSPTKSVQGRPALSYARFDQKLAGNGGVKRCCRKQVCLECNAGQVDQFKGQVRIGVETAGQQLHASPE